ncbi:MAG TPA: hypothetical protein VFL04_07765 [Rectinemataceae bacterium]|nr:hypothetical protein [Rectinemataceae bacterium]
MRIAGLNDLIEATLIDSMLGEQGIPHLVVSHSDAAYDGVFTVTRGWGHLEAAEEDRAAVLELLSALKLAKAEGGDRG